MLCLREDCILQCNVRGGGARLVTAAEGVLVQVGRLGAAVVAIAAVLGRAGSLAGFARAALASVVGVHVLGLLGGHGVALC